MTKEPLPLSFACKLGLWGGTTKFPAHAKVVAYPWDPTASEDKSDFNIQPDRSLEPGNETTLLGKAVPGADLFWFGTATVAVEARDLECFQGKAIALEMDDKSVRTAIVVKCHKSGDSTLYFVGLSPWPVAGFARPET